MTAPPPPDQAAARKPASGRLTALADGLEADVVTLGEVVDRLGHAGFGLVLLMVTLIVLIPIPGPLGVLLGAVIVFIAIQLTFGARRLWLPGFLRRRRVPSPLLQAMVTKSRPWLERVERRMTQRRWRVLSGRGARIALSAPLVLLGAAISLPIPLGNFLPAFALILISLGLVARDGLAILAGLVLTLVALAWTAALIFAGSEIVDFAFGWLG